MSSVRGASRTSHAIQQQHIFMIMSDTDNQRLSALLARIVDVEARISKLEAKRDDPITRVKAALLKKSIYSGKFVTVQSGYYDLTLDQRAELLKCTVPQLCKSIIFENTMHDPTVVDLHNNSKYYCVITQYTGKIDVLLCILYNKRFCVLSSDACIHPGLNRSLHQ